MIPKKETSGKRILSAVTYMSLKNLIKKGSQEQVEAFIKDISFNYIAAQNDAQIVDSDRCLVVENVNYECQCPQCKTWLSLDLLGLLEGGEKHDEQTGTDDVEKGDDL